MLDAPNLHDDFYMNLVSPCPSHAHTRACLRHSRSPLSLPQVDWSASNLLAVGLSNAVYTWNATTCKVNKLMELPAPHPSAGPATVTLATGISWSNRGSYLAIGTDPGEVQLWDPEKKACIRKLDGHRGRCCSLAWNGPVLATGSRDKLILQRDVRVPGTAVVQRLSTHKSEVCGLKWSHDGRELASGGNDNLLCIWSARGGGGSGGGRTHTEDTPLHRFDSTTGPGHRAAIKALAWSPHTSGLLATGGGTADKTIRLWNTVTGTELQCVETGSQVCNLAWSQNVDELVSTHGYSQNQIILWRHPGMVKLATLTGHSMRVLYLAVSPDGQNIVTGAGDETLRFWNMFPGQLVRPGAGPGNPLSLGRTSIR